jgi:hypothetical protein
MTSIWQKMNLDELQEVFILNPPKEFAAEITALKKQRPVAMSLKKGKPATQVIAFVKTQKEVDVLLPMITGRLGAEATLWMAYPNGGSRKHRAEIDRDRGWDILSIHGFSSVRQVSLDQEWSALCFRRSESDRMARQTPA